MGFTEEQKKEFAKKKANAHLDSGNLMKPFLKDILNGVEIVQLQDVDNNKSYVKFITGVNALLKNVKNIADKPEPYSAEDETKINGFFYGPSTTPGDLKKLYNKAISEDSEILRNPEFAKAVEIFSKLNTAKGIYDIKRDIDEASDNTIQCFMVRDSILKHFSDIRNYAIKMNKNVNYDVDYTNTEKAIAELKTRYKLAEEKWIAAENELTRRINTEGAVQGLGQKKAIIGVGLDEAESERLDLRHMQENLDSIKNIVYTLDHNAKSNRTQIKLTEESLYKEKEQLAGYKTAKKEYETKLETFETTRNNLYRKNKKGVNTVNEIVSIDEKTASIDEIQEMLKDETVNSWAYLFLRGYKGGNNKVAFFKHVKTKYDEVNKSDNRPSFQKNIDSAKDHIEKLYLEKGVSIADITGKIFKGPKPSEYLKELSQQKTELEANRKNLVADASKAMGEKEFKELYDTAIQYNALIAHAKNCNDKYALLIDQSADNIKDYESKLEDLKNPKLNSESAKKIWESWNLLVTMSKHKLMEGVVDKSLVEKYKNGIPMLQLKDGRCDLNLFEEFVADMKAFKNSLEGSLPEKLKKNTETRKRLKKEQEINNKQIAEQQKINLKEFRIDAEVKKIKMGDAYRRIGYVKDIDKDKKEFLSKNNELSTDLDDCNRFSWRIVPVLEKNFIEKVQGLFLDKYRTLNDGRKTLSLYNTTEYENMISPLCELIGQSIPENGTNLKGAEIKKKITIENIVDAISTIRENAEHYIAAKGTRTWWGSAQRSQRLSLASQLVQMCDDLQPQLGYFANVKSQKKSEIEDYDKWVAKYNRYNISSGLENKDEMKAMGNLMNNLVSYKVEDLVPAESNIKAVKKSAAEKEQVKPVNNVPVILH